MAAITASNVTIAPSAASGGAGRSASPSIEDNSNRYKVLSVAFGNGTLTYPAGGIPITGLAAQGFPYYVNSVEFIDDSSPDGYIYKYSRANKSIRIYTANATAGVGPLTEMSTTFAPPATTVIIRVYGR